MIIRRLDSLEGTDREVIADNWKSVRLLLKNDAMGFSLHETIIHAGTETEMWYKNHLEAVYCIEGVGEIFDKETLRRYAIEPGTLYALDKHDKHILKALSEMRMICVFNPPCIGNEIHDKDGSYQLLDQTKKEVLQ